MSKKIYQRGRFSCEYIADSELGKAIARVERIKGERLPWAERVRELTMQLEDLEATLDGLIEGADTDIEQIVAVQGRIGALQAIIEGDKVKLDAFDQPKSFADGAVSHAWGQLIGINRRLKEITDDSRRFAHLPTPEDRQKAIAREQDRWLRITGVDWEPI